jgi:hypothetical protein
MRETLILASFLLAGCAENIDIAAYRCSAEQWERVKVEVEFCKTSGYANYTCYATAKASHCTPLKAAAKAETETP